MYVEQYRRTVVITVTAKVKSIAIAAVLFLKKKKEYKKKNIG